MKIQVAGLSDGIHSYHFQLPATDLDLGGNFQNDVLVDTTLDKAGSQIYLRASVQTTGIFPCDRCITDFTTPLASSYQMYYVTEGSDYGHMDPTEVQVVSPGFSVIDLTDDVRQTVLLSVPFKLLCSETCKGLCSRCGKNLNKESCSCTESSADPRWEKLRSLQKNNMQGQN